MFTSSTRKHRPPPRPWLSIAVTMVSTLTAASSIASAQNEQADAAFCTYTLQQAMAQRDQLRTSSLIAGPIQPSTGTPAQFVVGVTNSLSDDRKASLTMKAAEKTCQLYRTTTDAQIHIFYALPNLERNALRNRLYLIEAASGKLDLLTTDVMKLVNSGNLPLTAAYVLQSSKYRLDTDLNAALAGIGSISAPEMVGAPRLRLLITEKLASENQAQRAEAKLLKQSSWDIQLSTGFRRSLSTDLTTVGVRPAGAFGAFNISYSFGRGAIGRHLDKAVDSYNQWKNTQFDDVAAQAALLHKQIEDTITSETDLLTVLKAHEAEIETNLRVLDSVDTNKAVEFRNNLLANRLVLQVDIDDVTFRLSQLQQYITDNF